MGHPMRVLFQSRPNALTDWGGDTTQMVKTRDRLGALGVHVDFSLDPRPDVREYDLVHVFNLQNSTFHVRQVENAKRQGRAVALSTIFWDLAHVPRAHQAGTIHASALARLLYRVHRRLPFLPWDLKLLLGNREEWRQGRRMLELADILLPNSYAELEILAQAFQAPWVRTKALVVPNGADPPRDPTPEGMERARDLPSEVVLEVGRFSVTKGQRVLLEALTGLPEIPVVLVGAVADAAYARECQRLARSRGNVHFPGAIPHEHLAALYRRAKVHALPSLRESPGLTTLEAASYGANCVVSLHGPVAEYFGPDAWYCDPTDRESVRDAVVEAWEAERTGRLGHRVQREFTWEKAGELTRQAYEIALSRRNRSHGQDS